MTIKLWVEEYRPDTLEGYVFKNDSQREKVEGWIKDGGIPHLLFSGSPGTGKTTLAKILINELKVQPNDVCIINASRDNGVDTIRRQITGFSETMPWGDFKVILLDEADHISQEGQAALRGVMELYHSSVRFILTCNYPNMIVPAIHSRCQGFHIASLDQTEFTVRVAEILVSKEVDFELETLDSYVRATYPDLRKTINTVQMSVKDGVLQSPDSGNTGGNDWKLNMVGLFKEGKVKEARKLICDSARTDEYNELFTFLYRNLEFFGDTEDKQDEAVLIIKKGMVDHTRSADPEINLSATLIQLANI